MSKRLKKFTVIREDWFRGKGGEPSRLLTRKGKMCCLGFCARSLGYRRQSILTRTGPDDTVLRTSRNRWPSSLLQKDEGGPYWNTELCAGIISINDDTSSSDEYKEAKLKKRFEQAGFKVDFV